MISKGDLDLVMVIVLGVVKKKMPASFFTLQVALEHSGVSTVRIEVEDFNEPKGLGIDTVEQLETKMNIIRAPNSLLGFILTPGSRTILFRWP